MPVVRFDSTTLISTEWYHTVGTIPKSIKKNHRKGGKIDTPNTQYIHDPSFPWLGTGTSLKKWLGLTSYMCPNIPSQLIQNILIFSMRYLLYLYKF